MALKLGFPKSSKIYKPIWDWGNAILWHPLSSYIGSILEWHKHILQWQLLFHRSQSHAFCFVYPRHSLKLPSCTTIFETADHTCYSLCKRSPCDLQCRILFGVIICHMCFQLHMMFSCYSIYVQSPLTIPKSGPKTSRRFSGKSWAVRGSEASIQIRHEWQGQQAAGGSQSWLKWVEAIKSLDTRCKMVEV